MLNMFSPTTLFPVPMIHHTTQVIIPSNSLQPLAHSKFEESRHCSQVLLLCTCRKTTSMLRTMSFHLLHNLPVVSQTRLASKQLPVEISTRNQGDKMLRPRLTRRPSCTLPGHTWVLTNSLDNCIKLAPFRMFIFISNANVSWWDTSHFTQVSCPLARNLMRCFRKRQWCNPALVFRPG